MNDKPKKNSKLVILIALMAVLLAGGGFLYKFLTSPDSGITAEGTANTEDPGKSGEQQSAGDSIDSEELQDAPDFPLIDAEGNTYMLSDKYGGKPIVLNFWASWCPPCKSEMPDYQAVYEKYSDRVQFIMVDVVDEMQESMDSGKEFLESNGYTFPINYDMGGKGIVTYTGGSIPCSVFITPDGKIHDGILGATNKAYLEERIEKLLAY